MDVEIILQLSSRLHFELSSVYFLRSLPVNILNPLFALAVKVTLCPPEYHTLNKNSS